MLHIFDKNKRRKEYSDDYFLFLHVFVSVTIYGIKYSTYIVSVKICSKIWSNPKLRALARKFYE